MLGGLPPFLIPGETDGVNGAAQATGAIHITKANIKWRMSHPSLERLSPYYVPKPEYRKFMIKDTNGRPRHRMRTVAIQELEGIYLQLMVLRTAAPQGP
jgi:hypothetical protein